MKTILQIVKMCKKCYNVSESARYICAHRTYKGGIYENKRANC